MGQGKECRHVFAAGTVSGDPVTRFRSHLGMWLKVHGVFRQRSSTREMIFDVPTVVSYVSRFMTCCPVISSAPEHRLESGWA